MIESQQAIEIPKLATPVPAASILQNQSDQNLTDATPQTKTAIVTPHLQSGRIDIVSYLQDCGEINANADVVMVTDNDDEDYEDDDYYADDKYVYEDVVEDPSSEDPEQRFLKEHAQNTAK